MSRAIIFPGQGSQSVGMGRGLASQYPEAREVFEAVDDALGVKLSAVIWNGPDEELTLTENAQPALMAVSLATFRVLENQGFNLSNHADYVAGHSLGEYSALAASGALTLADTAKLLRIRGKAMQQAVPVGVGAMAALLGPDFETVVEIAAKASTDEEICSAANDNAPGQVVISGSAAAVARAIDLAKEAGAKRAVELPVSAPFHCSLMSPAADAMRDALAGQTKDLRKSTGAFVQVQQPDELADGAQHAEVYIVGTELQRASARAAVTALAESASPPVPNSTDGGVLIAQAIPFQRDQPTLEELSRVCGVSEDELVDIGSARVVALMKEHSVLPVQQQIILREIAARKARATISARPHTTAWSLASTQRKRRRQSTPP